MVSSVHALNVRNEKSINLTSLSCRHFQYKIIHPVSGRTKCITRNRSNYPFAACFTPGLALYEYKCYWAVKAGQPY